MSQEQQKNTYADSNSMAAGDTQMKTMNSIVPGSKKTKTISIYNPFTEKMSRVAPYSAKAKKIYRYYIKELGYDPAWIVPGDLKFHDASSRFTRLKKSELPQNITSDSSYKGYFATHTLNNLDKVPGYAGFQLLQEFRSQLSAALQKHGGLKVYATARCLMHKTLEGEVIAENEDFYISTRITQITSATSLNDGLSSMVSAMEQRVPEQDALHLPHPMNAHHLHAVPKRKRVTDCRISLTLREIVPG